eukprot:1668055-Alexandrium_andersonii.AAC.1
MANRNRLARHPAVPCSCRQSNSRSEVKFRELCCWLQRGCVEMRWARLHSAAIRWLALNVAASQR